MKLFTKNKDHVPNGKSHKARNILLSILAVLLLSPVLIAGWMGFVPVLSNIMGSAKPKDLGVKYSQNDVSSYKQKSAIEFKDYSIAPSIVNQPDQKSYLAGPRTVNNMNLTQEEVTAAINNAGFSWLPFSGVQVKLSENQIEISGSLDSSKIEAFSQYISGGGTPSPEMANVINWSRRLSNNAPVYLKANAQIDNNILSFTLLKAQIGRLNIPLGKIGSDLTSGTTTNLRADNFNTTSARLTPGNLNFTGTYPSIIYVKQ